MAKFSPTSKSSAPARDFSEAVPEELRNVMKEIAKEEVVKMEDKFDDKIAQSTLRSVEILTIFVAMFSFISIEFSLFKSDLAVLSAVGFSLILLGSLLMFISIMNDLVFNRFKQKQQTLSTFWIYPLAFILILSGSYYAFDDKNRYKNIIDSVANNCQDSEVLTCLKNLLDPKF